MHLPSGTTRYSILGFVIRPSQTLRDEKVRGLETDLVSLLSSLTYSPQSIEKTTLDLRYVVCSDDSLAGKRLDIALLARIRYETSDESIDFDRVASRFREDLYNLLTLNLHPYGFDIDLLTKSDVDSYLHPFPVSDVVEVVRRIAEYKPFQMRRFEGRSPMSKIVDMMLRERGQRCLSILLEPHQMTDQEQDKMAVFGYQTQILPSNPDEKLLQGILGFQAQARSMFSSFRMKIRIVGDNEISQYLINLVGSEISGQQDFFYFRPEDDRDVSKEIASFQNLHFETSLNDVIQLDIPDILLDLVYIFPPSEATSAFRLPTERVSAARERLFVNYHAPVANLPKEGLLIGTSEHPSYQDGIPIYFQPKDRKKHCYIVGKTGTGKSMMMLGMIKQDIESNRGLCVIDPHGDLIEAIFPCIPEQRKEDVWLFDPADEEYVIGFNFLQATSAHPEAERDYLLQEVISMLLRTVDYNMEMFGPRAQEWTRMACMTLMALPTGGTLLEVPRLFEDEDYLRRVLEHVDDPLLQNWWKNNFLSQSDYHRSEMLGYFTSKYTPLVSGPQVRNVVGQLKSDLDFQEIMNQGKILLVNLSRGKIGAQNSALLGSMFVSRILWTAMRRAWEPEESRREFYLYVDEFQNFITDSFETILSQARKFGLNLTIANQHLEQLRAMGRLGNKIERAIFGNVGTTVAFRLGTDASTVAEVLGEPTTAATLRNLENRYAVTQVLVDNAPTTPFTIRTVDWTFPQPEQIAVGQRMKQYVRRRGAPIREVDKEIKSRYGDLFRSRQG